MLRVLPKLPFGRGVDVGAELFSAGVGFGVRACEDLLVDGDVDPVVVAGAGDGDVAARVVYVEGGVGGEGLIEGLVALMLVAEELVEVVRVEVEAMGEYVAMQAADAAPYRAGDAEEDE